MIAGQPFDSIYSHGFLRAAVSIPRVRVADPEHNAGRILALARRAAEAKAGMVLFPELCVSAYSNEDLFHQDALLDASGAALDRLRGASREIPLLLCVGAPLVFEGKLFNCAVALHRGRILGVTPKTYLPNYREFYEKRQFTSGLAAVRREVRLLGEDVPFGNDIIYDASGVRGFSLHVEICEDLWVPIPPSTYAALAGATVLANLSASNITIGKAVYRRELCQGQSGKCVAAYLYAAAGPGESTTDLAWDGHGIICENGVVLAESERFSSDEQLITADIDLERLAQERMRLSSFADAGAEHLDRLRSMRRVPFDLDVPQGAVPLERAVERFPYVPSDPAARDERCYDAYNIQVHGLMGRLKSTGLERIVIGVSGGLDSTHALIVTARTMDRLGLPRKNILAYSMPGFATSERTRSNAMELMRAVGASAAEIDIRPSCMQMLKDIGHPFKDGKPHYDVTFENVQAGERTSHLFRLANHQGGFVVGTGDLSELALGWCTYGVGDHMSHYAVNASVPKTLIQHLIRWIVRSRQLDDTTRRLLDSILDTEISPELIPGEMGEGGQPAQSTESVIGPYDLQDFHLYYTTRFGFRPSKIAFLSHHAWGDRTRGAWPDELPSEKHREYSLGEVKKWLQVFLHRFFKLSQFKRSCLPNGPKVGSGGSLSPRGDWRAPSDSEADAWLKELRDHVP
ncbi:MAG TPA: NAD(+) synthase [Planctomycetota bacterium]|nr:NAD(+) synthase [Planctomycetota bacterium]